MPVMARLRTGLRSNPLAAKLLENISWLLFERMLLMVVGLGVNVWFVRAVGPEGYGQYSYAVSFVGLFSAFVTLGMDVVVVRELTRHPDAEGEILGTALTLRSAAGIVAWLGASAAVAFVARDASSRALVAIIAFNSPFVGLSGIELWFQAKMAGRALVLARSAVTLGSYAVRVVLIVIGAKLSAFAVVLVVTTAVTDVVLWAVWRRASEKGATLRWSRRFARDLWTESWPLIAMTVSVAIYMKIDQVMLTSMRGTSENGIYATAVTLSEIWYFVPVAVATSAFPVLVATRDKGDAAATAVVTQRFYDGMVGVGYAIAAPLFMAAGPIIRTLFGPEYQGSVPAFRIHIASLVFVCMGVARGRYLIVEGLTRFALWATVSGAVVNIGLNLALIPNWGSVGAAWATLLAYFVANFLSGFAYSPVRLQSVLLGKALLGPLRAARSILGAMG